MQIKKVAILGAGAVGSYVIWGLSQRNDISLGIVAENERAERLKKGCFINDETYNPQVWTTHGNRYVFRGVDPYGKGAWDTCAVQ